MAVVNAVPTLALFCLDFKYLLDISFCVSSGDTTSSPLTSTRLTDEPKFQFQLLEF